MTLQVMVSLQVLLLLSMYCSAMWVYSAHNENKNTPSQNVITALETKENKSTEQINK